MLEGPHRYLRAYLAGLAFPTMFLAVLLSVFSGLAASGRVPWSASQVLIFPMAVVPNVWGLWNVIYALLAKRRRFNIGLFGALLPFVLAPLGYATAKANGFEPQHSWGTLAVAFIVAVIVYYLIWRHLVKFLNESLDVD